MMGVIASRGDGRCPWAASVLGGDKRHLRALRPGGSVDLDSLRELEIYGGQAEVIESRTGM
jgi:hypothetical protein